MAWTQLAALSQTGSRRGRLGDEDGPSPPNAWLKQGFGFWLLVLLFLWVPASGARAAGASASRLPVRLGTAAWYQGLPCRQRKTEKNQEVYSLTAKER